MFSRPLFGYLPTVTKCAAAQMINLTRRRFVQLSARSLAQ